MFRTAGVTVEASAAPRQAVVAPLSWTRRWFYVAITLLLMAMVVRGFWSSYFGSLLSGAPTRPSIIHLHGAVFSGWMVLLLTQVSLVASGRVRLHRRVGRAAIAYGVVVFIVGLLVAFVAPVLHVRAGEWSVDRAAAFLLLPLVDMALFGVFFVAAIAFRKRPEIHKRLILAATVALAFPAVARMSFRLPQVFLVVWLSPLFGAMAFDLWVRRRVHPVHFISVSVMGVAFVRIFFMDSDGWLRIGHVLLAPFV